MHLERQLEREAHPDLGAVEALRAVGAGGHRSTQSDRYIAQGLEHRPVKARRGGEVGRRLSIHVAELQPKRAHRLHAERVTTG
jgi:hypothetical protein